MLAHENTAGARERLLSPVPAGAREAVSRDALAFVAELARTFRPRVDALLERRRRVQAEGDRGVRLSFCDPSTDKVCAEVKNGDWKVAKLPDELLQRRVEITGPTDAKMIINALNSGADVFMADLEDATCPTWENVTLGQQNLYEAVRGTITFDDAQKQKTYALAEKTALLMVRPRGWHLEEAHFVVDKRRVPAALFDFGIYFFQNARELLARGHGPYFYLPKLEGGLEARLWNDVFNHAERALGLPHGVTKATVLIETLGGAFCMEEILYELRDHAAGLNCGRWDYIFSFIKLHRADMARVLPDRAAVTMTQPFMRAYTELVVKVCHRRGAMAIGGMAAQIPIRDPEKNAAALEKVRADKVREAKNGHDGTWVAHPGLVSVAMEVFTTALAGKKNQLDVARDDVKADARALTEMPTGPRTEGGLRQNLRIGVAYLAAWLDGKGCVPLDNLMEDAATAEISRAQVWEWAKKGARLDDGRTVTRDLVVTLLAEEVRGLHASASALNLVPARIDEAARLFLTLVDEPVLPDFLTNAAYEQVVSEGR
jgi:malate synthase